MKKIKLALGATLLIGTLQTPAYANADNQYGGISRCKMGMPEQGMVWWVRVPCFAQAFFH